MTYHQQINVQAHQRGVTVIALEPVGYSDLSFTFRRGGQLLPKGAAPVATMDVDGNLTVLDPTTFVDGNTAERAWRHACDWNKTVHPRDLDTVLADAESAPDSPYILAAARDAIASTTDVQRQRMLTEGAEGKGPAAAQLAATWRRADAAGRAAIWEKLPRWARLLLWLEHTSWVEDMMNTAANTRLPV